MENNDDKAVDYHRQCRYYAHRMGCDVESEYDFAAFALIKLLENKQNNYKWAFVDYFRSKFGRPGSQRSKMSRELKRTTSLDFLEQTPRARERVSCLDFRLLEGIKDADLFILYHAYGYEDPEIGRFLGVTGSRVQQRRLVVSEKVKKRLSKSPAACSRWWPPR